jgi:hypothetical protein
MGAVAELVRAKSTEFSLNSTKYPLVFFEKNMRAIGWNYEWSVRQPAVLRPVCEERA